jgi:DNA-binding transcriptional LysR family regulator
MGDHATQLLHALVSRLKMRHLVLLQAIDRHRVLSRVAIEMRLSQPAITKALREIEDIFMTPLFERTPRGLTPTAAGRVVLHYALVTLAGVESTARSLTAIDVGLTGRVRIGVTPQVPQSLLTAAMAHLLGQAPRVAVLAREGTTDELVAALAARELDCAIGRSFQGSVDAEVTQEVIYEQEACLLAPASSAARMSRGELNWSRLAALDWIFPPPNTPMRRTFNTIFLSAGVEPPAPMVETVSLKVIETVLRYEPHAITILARDVSMELADNGHCTPLRYRLAWNLPPVSLFVARSMLEQPTIIALTRAIRFAAKALVERVTPAGSAG